MELLLAFSPFLAFLVGERHLGLVPALWAGAAVAVALVVRARLRGTRDVRVLEVGTAILLAAIAACAMTVPGIAWSVGLVRLVVDIGLMGLVLAGIAIGRPFTLAFARARVSPERAASPQFLRTASRVAAAWAGAFGVLAIADVVLILEPAWPIAVPVAIGVAGLLAAAAFTRWLPARVARGGA